MNKAMLIGNLTRDPDLRTTPSGTSVCNFTLAVSRRFSNQQGEREADFIPIVVWRTQAENCAKYLRKGSQVAISGSIQTRNYEAQDGSRRYVTEIVADEVKFLSRTVGRSEAQGAQGAQTPPPARQNEPVMNEIDEELPF